MKKTEVTLITGDGIGPDISEAVVKIVEAAGGQIKWDRQIAGMTALEQTGDPLPEATLESIRRTGIALKGPLATPSGGGYRSINVTLRKEFDMYANVRPIETLMPSPRGYEVNMVMIRENTEDSYAGIEKTITDNAGQVIAGETVARITRSASERIAKYAFEFALRTGRKKVTLVHKANIMKASQGLFLEVGKKVAEEYKGLVEFEERIVDAMAMHLIMRPEQFDVILATNMNGDILSDEMAGLVGGLGLAPGANIGSKAAMFEAVHGTAPDIAGKDLANPGALLLAAAMMLEHIGQTEPARVIRQIFKEALNSKKCLTKDLGGQAGTQEFTKHLIALAKAAVKPERTVGKVR